MNLIENILKLSNESEKKFSGIMYVDEKLSRQHVSFQANKKQAFHKWFKYKEGFSADLVKYFFQNYNIKDGPVLDPFAGIGTTLFVSSELGLKSEGIELLPSSNAIIKARKLFLSEVTDTELEIIKEWKDDLPWNKTNGKKELTFFRITKGAYPEIIKEKIEKYLFELDKIENIKSSQILFFALLSILESVSYTRKDGQYLRWDYRSGRQVGAVKFDKGEILDFDYAIDSKLNDILTDYNAIKFDSLFETIYEEIKLMEGSCLDIMPQIESTKYQAIMTSPPYCNRYDYTRTYALELGLLELNQLELNELRQTMLSCTVENREKDLLKKNNKWDKPLEIVNNHTLLQSVIQYLEHQKKQKLLNNNGIIRMVKNYFTELACVLYESHRVLKNGGYLFMVNDNVRYAGISIPVDLILSDIANNLGFKIENIIVLPQGKGNSSQQMGEFGREELRKCIYVWRK